MNQYHTMRIWQRAVKYFQKICKYLRPFCLHPSKPHSVFRSFVKQNQPVCFQIKTDRVTDRKWPSYDAKVAELRVVNSPLFTGERHGTAPTRQIRERIGDHLCAFLCVLTTLLLPSCSTENDPLPGNDGSDDNLVPVTISISAQDAAVTRVYGGDDNANAGEFMETLWIFVVDKDNKIEKKIYYNQFDKVNGKGGCGTEYASDPMYLTTGTKTIYAFANMENATMTTSITVGATQYTNLSAWLNALNEKDTWPTTDIESCVISAPAATVDFDKGQYIPMSVKYDEIVTISGSKSQTVSLQLIRLVGRVDAVLENKSGAEVTVKNFTMDGLPDRVALFDNGTAAGITGITVTAPISDGGITIGNGESKSVSFYVNGMQAGGNGFPVTLALGTHSLSGTTKTTLIPRNNILPLHLTIGNTLNLEINAYIAPVGVYPITVYTKANQFQLIGDKDNSDMEATLPEGCTFDIKASMKMHNDGGVTINWTTTDDNLVTLEKVSDSEIYGSITAIANKKIKLDYSVTAPVSMSGSLTITTEPLDDLTKYSKSTMRWGAPPSRYEQVTLSPTNQ